MRAIPPPRVFKSTSNTARRSFIQEPDHKPEERSNATPSDDTDRVLTADPVKEQTVIVPLLPVKKQAKRKSAVPMKRGVSQAAASEQRKSNPMVNSAQASNPKNLLKKQKSRSQKEFTSPYYKYPEKAAVSGGKAVTLKKPAESRAPSKVAVQTNKHTASHKTLRNVGEMVLQKDPPVKNIAPGSLFFGKERTREIPHNKTPIKARYLPLNQRRGRSPISARDSEDIIAREVGGTRPRSANSSNSPGGT